MKAVLISIRPQYCELIANGQKTIEVRKTRPKIETPFKCYIYCSQSGKYVDGKQVKNIWVNRGTDYRYIGNGKVIGEFVCDKVVRTCGWRLRGDTQQCAKRTAAEEELPKLACMAIDEIVDYAGSENREVVGWHISDLKIYDKPKELSEFSYWLGFISDGATDNHGHLKRPPQSWCYVEDRNETD